MPTHHCECWTKNIIASCVGQFCPNFHQKPFPINMFLHPTGQWESLTCIGNIKNNTSSVASLRIYREKSTTSLNNNEKQVLLLANWHKHSSTCTKHSLILITFVFSHLLAIHMHTNYSQLIAHLYRHHFFQHKCPRFPKDCWICDDRKFGIYIHNYLRVWWRHLLDIHILCALVHC